MKVYAVVVQGFILEHRKQFDSAISAYEIAIKLLEHLMPRIKKDMRKIHRKMFERQLDVLRERKAILDQSALANSPFAGLLSPPTILSADAELEAAVHGKFQLLSLVSLLVRIPIYLPCLKEFFICLCRFQAHQTIRMNEPFTTTLRLNQKA